MSFLRAPLVYPATTSFEKISDELIQHIPSVDELPDARLINTIPWFPQDQLWRLYIDGEAQSLNDPMIFDKGNKIWDAERGYFLAMSRAFLFMERTVGMPVTLELLVALHNAAVEGVNLNGGSHRVTQKGIRGANVTNDSTREIIVGLSINSASQLGIIEAFNLYSDFFTIRPEAAIYRSDIHTTFKDPKETWQLIQVGRNSGFLRLVPARFDNNNTKQFFICSTNKLIFNYYYNVNAIILSGLSARKKQACTIREIVTLVHSLSILHPFTDGNTRTFVFLLMNKLFIQNNLPVAIIHKPNQFDFYSADELCLAALEGMEAALALQRAQCHYDLDFSWLKSVFSKQMKLANFTIQPESILLLSELQTGFTHFFEKMCTQQGFGLELEFKLPTSVLMEFAKSRQCADNIEMLLRAHHHGAMPEFVEPVATIQVAALLGHTKIVEMLLAKKVNLNFVIGISLLEIALALRHPEMVKLVRSHLAKERFPLQDYANASSVSSGASTFFKRPCSALTNSVSDQVEPESARGFSCH